MLLLIGAILILHDVLKPKSKWFSMYYDVTRKQNGDIIFNPKEGVSHDSTIIFLHDYGDTNQNIFEIFAQPYHGKNFAPKTAKIILP